MILDPVTVATRWARHLPGDFARDLASALRAGPAALQMLQAKVALPASSAAVRTGLALVQQGDGGFAAGVLTGQLDAAAAAPHVTPVWTGPESDARHGRLTLAVVVDLIAETEQELVLASYATLPGDSVRQALSDVVDRGVAVTLLLERQRTTPTSTATATPSPACRRVA